MLHRRTFVSGIALMAGIFLLQRPALADEQEELYKGTPLGLAPGDYGYKHDVYHPAYQELFGRLGRCSCGTGDCRVTDWRFTQLGSKHRFDVVIKRRWWPLQDLTWMPENHSVVPKILFKERAHVCAYGETLGEPIIACALINFTEA